MKRFQSFLPAIQWIATYRREYLSGDISAGLTVGIMLIPQGMAYALIAGLPPVYGLYAAIVPPFIYAMFGTSRQLSIGPVAMDSLLVATGVSVLATEGTEAYIGFTILLALLVGFFQLLLGIFRMGFITNLLSKPVISGFTSAAAIVIALNQLKYLLGADIGKSSQVYEIVWNTIQKVNETHLVTLLIGLGGIALIQGMKRLHSNIPGALMAVVIGTAIVYGLQLNEDGVSIVKSIPGGFPSFSFPDLDMELFRELIPLALTLSVIGYIEAYSIARALGGAGNGSKVVANRELIGLGAANFIGALFQSFPVSGGFTRSAVNLEVGARTPLASVISAGLVALTLTFLTPLFHYLPHAILASVIMGAVFTLIDVGYAKKLWKESKVEFGLLIVTFLVTLNVSMVYGIIAGVILSILVLLYRAANPHIAQLGRLKGQTEFRNVKRFSDLELWEDKLILRIDAPLTFINIQFVKDYIQLALDKNPRVRQLVLDAAAVNYVDASASQGLKDLLRMLDERAVRLVLAELVGPVRDTLYKTGLLEAIEPKNIYLTINDALADASVDETSRSQAATQHGENE